MSGVNSQIRAVSAALKQVSKEGADSRTVAEQVAGGNQKLQEKSTLLLDTYRTQEASYEKLSLIPRELRQVNRPALFKQAMGHCFGAVFNGLSAMLNRKANPELAEAQGKVALLYSRVALQLLEVHGLTSTHPTWKLVERVKTQVSGFEERLKEAASDSQNPDVAAPSDAGSPKDVHLSEETKAYAADINAPLHSGQNQFEVAKRYDGDQQTNVLFFAPGQLSSDRLLRPITRVVDTAEAQRMLPHLMKALSDPSNNIQGIDFSLTSVAGLVSLTFGFVSDHPENEARLDAVLAEAAEKAQKVKAATIEQKGAEAAAHHGEFDDELQRWANGN